MGRPPLSEERLSKTSDGKLRIKLKSSWADGTTQIILTPMEFMERLVSLVPPPRKNTIRYSGVFAPNFRLRRQIIHKDKAAPDLKEPLHPTRKKRYGWGKLMARVYEIDVYSCPRCGSQMQTISFITDPQTITNILISLKMPTAPPEIAQVDSTLEPPGISYHYGFAD